MRLRRHMHRVYSLPIDSIQTCRLYIQFQIDEIWPVVEMYFALLWQKDTFCVKMQNVSVISTDINGIS